MKTPFITAVITCGGSSSRMKGVNKILNNLGEIPTVGHSLLAFQKNDNISAIIVTARECDAEKIRGICRELKIDKLRTVTKGGDCREASVLCGVMCCPEETDFVLVHDGARPFVTQEVINRVCAALSDGNKSVCPAVALKDTAVLIDDNGTAAQTLNRPLVRLIQTPEGLDFKIFKKTLTENRERLSSFTDDCSVLAACGIKARIVEGDPKNIKLTSPEDLIFADAILKSRERSRR